MGRQVHWGPASSGGAQPEPLPVRDRDGATGAHCRSGLGSLRLAHTVTVSLASVAARLGVTGTPIFRPPMVKSSHELRLGVDPLRLPPLSERRASDPDAGMCQCQLEEEADR